MLFLIEMIQERPMPADQAECDSLKARVCLTLDRLACMPDVHGGVIAGARAVVFVIEAADVEALDATLQGLPLWSCVETTRVTPLVPFLARLRHNHSL